MRENHFVTLEELGRMQPDPSGRLHSATHAEIFRGVTTDIYFVRTRELLEKMKPDTEVTVKCFIKSRRSGRHRRGPEPAAGAGSEYRSFAGR